MFGFRICLLVALVVATTSVTSAEDYVVPTGVTVLTEEQLLNQIIGSTITAGNSRSAYFLPPSGDRMDTDIIARLESGLLTVLELSGVCQRKDVPQYPFRPDYIISGVGEIPRIT